jgi:hypothetical protein
MNISSLKHFDTLHKEQFINGRSEGISVKQRNKLDKNEVKVKFYHYTNHNNKTITCLDVRVQISPLRAKFSCINKICLIHMPI